MSNTFVNPTIVASEALRQIENNCVMGNLVFRGYEAEWKKRHNSYKPGQSITIQCPVYARVKDSATLDAVEILERSTTLSLSYRKHVAFAITSEEMTYSTDEFNEKYTKAAGVALANYVDNVLLSLYKYVPNQVGTPGQTPNSFLTFALANAKLSEHAVPEENRFCVVDPQCQAYTADNLKGLFHPAIVGKAVERAKFGMIAGLDMYMSQNVNTHTCGTAAGRTDGLVDQGTAVAEGATGVYIDNNGSWSYTLKQGDIFTVAAVYGVNPISGASTGSLRQFVVEADLSDAGNEGLISCTPGVSPYQMYSASATEKYLPYQNMDTLPADNAIFSVAGSTGLQHKVNIAAHRDAFALAMVPLAVPASVTWKGQASSNGYSIRVIRDYDVTNDQEYVRYDILFGIKAINPFFGCRVAG